MKSRPFQLLGCFVCLFVLAKEVRCDGPIVQTKYGKVQGLALELSGGGAYDAFFGIPFAGPGGGDSRWNIPRSPSSWSGTYNATVFRPYCPQLITPFYKIIGLNDQDSEDCLYLNIYVPGGVEEASDMPVMFFVFGGIFLIGNSDMYPGEDLAVNGKVIVVSINYRVGTMGFLSSGDRYAEGNYGLWDQVQALKWVNENIAMFGGDPSRVTIFGQSAGSASVSHLSLSPLTKNLFKRVISISGSSTAYFGSTSALPQTTQSLALTVVCPSVQTDRMVNCLRKRGPTLLDLAGLAAPFVLHKRLPNWLPRVDGYLVSTDPRRAVEQGANKDVDLLVGHTQHDAAFIIYANPLGLGYGKWINLANNTALLRFALRLMLTPYENPEELESLIIEQYPAMFDEDVDVRTKSVVQAITDFVFASPAIVEAEYHSRFASSKNRRTYLYQYSYRQSFLKYEDWVEGSHIDDMYSVLGEPFMDDFRKKFLRRRWKRDDIRVKDTVQKYYANFAYSGNPNQGPHEIEEFWPQYNDEDKSFMDLKLNSEVRSLKGDRFTRHEFWSDKFYRRAIPTSEKDGNPLDHIEAARDLLLVLLEHLGNITEAIEEGDNTPLEEILAYIKQLIEGYGEEQ